MTLISELQSLDLDTEVELYELTQFDPRSANDIFRFCAYSGVVFQGNSYNVLPCELEGLEYTAEGAFPRPKLRVSDAGQLITGLIYQHDGIEGAQITIRKTLRRFLDGQVNANPNAEKPRDLFIVSQIIQSVPGKYIEFELCSPFDFVDETVPRRLACRTCFWRYRSEECGYTGRQGYDLFNRPVILAKNDKCAKTVDACQARFGKNTELPFGGFPGLSRR